jgi:hypothetical protein
VTDHQNQVDTSLKDQLDLKIRHASYRVLQAMTLKRQKRLAVWTSAALVVATVVEPNLPRELLAVKSLVDSSAIETLLLEVADDSEEKLTDEQIAARMEALLPADKLDPLVTGQRDLLRVLTRQHTWQRQMEGLMEENRDAWATLLAGFGSITGDLAYIIQQVERGATAAQVAELQRLIETEVLPRLGEAQRDVFIPDPPPDPDAPIPAPGPLPPGSRGYPCRPTRSSPAARTSCGAGNGINTSDE